MPEHLDQNARLNPHVIDLDFGRDIAIEEYLGDLFRMFPRITSIETNLLVTDQYESIFGIYNHNNQSNTREPRPLALIAMHEAEYPDAYDHKKIKRKLYISANVLKYTGIPLHEFFDLPTVEVDEILNECMERCKKDGSEVDAVRRQLDNITNKK